MLGMFGLGGDGGAVFWAASLADASRRNIGSAPTTVSAIWRTSVSPASKNSLPLIRFASSRLWISNSCLSGVRLEKYASTTKGVGTPVALFSSSTLSSTRRVVQPTLERPGIFGLDKTYTYPFMT